jgi:hypothetical protein
MKQWYVTVCVPGGEYACFTDGAQIARDSLNDLPISAGDATCESDGSYGYDYFVRVAPPELAEWLDAPMHCIMAWNTDLLRAKVPGGWIYYQHEISRDPDNGMRIIHDSAQCFVPVALASGITIIGEAPDVH